MKNFHKCSQKGGNCSTRKKIFAVEEEGLIPLPKMRDI